MEAMNRLQATLYYPARHLLEWELKWHRRLLETPNPERDRKRAFEELGNILDMVEGTSFEREWTDICTKAYDIILAQARAGRKWEEV